MSSAVHSVDAVPFADPVRRRAFARLVREARPHWPRICLLSAISALAMPLTLLAPVPVQIAVDHVIGAQPLPAPLAAVLPDAWTTSGTAILILAVILQVGIAVLVQAQAVGVWLYSTAIGQRIVRDFRYRLFRRAQCVSLAYHDRAGTTDSVYRILYDAPAIRHVVVDGVVPLVSSVLTMAAMLTVIALLSGRLALVAIVIAPLLFVATRYFATPLRHAWHEVKKLESAAQSVVQQALSSLRVVKSFRRETHEADRFARVTDDGIATNQRVLRGEAAVTLLVGLIFASGTATVLFLGVRDVQTGALTVGQFWIVLHYLQRLYEPMKAMGKRITGLQRSLASAERAFSLADHPAEVPEAAEPVALARARGAVRFEQVSFGYRPEQPVLVAADFEVAPGERIGVVGETGSGKSTLLALLLRLYDPDRGCIRLDGVDLRDYRLDDLRRQIAVVLQEPVLFAATIAENIAYARPTATRGEIEAAAEAAGARGFIELMPEGFETVVGERGQTLSGGERQRVSLARAYLLDAPLLVLDEPTSSVDLDTEQSILAAMDGLMRGRTTFMIAHRLQTLRHCDRVLRVRGGAVRAEPIENLLAGAAGMTGS